MNWEALRLGLDLLAYVGILANSLYVWWTSKQQADKAALTRVEEALKRKIEAVEHDAREDRNRLYSLHNTMDREITAAKEQIKFSPRSADLQALRESISHLSQTVSRNEGTQNQLVQLVGRMNQYLMEREK